MFPVPTDFCFNITFLRLISTHDDKKINHIWLKLQFFKCTAEEEPSMSGWLQEKRLQDHDSPKKGQSCYYVIVNLVEYKVYIWLVSSIS